MIQYDTTCQRCNEGRVQHGDESELCKNCDGYGYLLTFEGRLLIEFLERRGLHIPMTPLAEEELRGVLE